MPTVLPYGRGGPPGVLDEEYPVGLRSDPSPDDPGIVDDLPPGLAEPKGRVEVLVRGGDRRDPANRPDRLDTVRLDGALDPDEPLEPVATGEERVGHHVVGFREAGQVLRRVVASHRLEPLDGADPGTVVLAEPDENVRVNVEVCVEHD